MAKLTLNREVQCAKCPWKKSTNPLDIPNGYKVSKHRKLRATIAVEGSLQTTGRVMACHEEHEAHCIGWLLQQLGPGNNIPLRMAMMQYDLSRVRTVGPQHDQFEDTLPRPIHRKKKVQEVL